MPRPTRKRRWQWNPSGFRKLPAPGASIRREPNADGPVCLTQRSTANRATIRRKSETRFELSDQVHDHARRHLPDRSCTYVFVDELQRIEGWQDAVNAMRVDFDCDIYLTGSNAYLLSSELSTYLSGRYVEVKMLPLSFSEFADFCGVGFSSGRSAALSPDGEPVLFDEMLTRYLEYGGMPAIASLSTTQAQHSAYMSGIYEAIAVRDIVNRERGKGKSAVTDPSLLRHVAEFLADNIGNECSPNGIAGTLTSAGSKTTNKTVSSYVGALEEAFLFYRATRYDLHGKALLKTNPKEYIVDTGFRTWMAGYRVTDTGRLFENAVYLQLLYEGWSVHVGKLYGKEVDFVATKDGRVLYVQATDEMLASETREREVAPLKSIRDNHEKIVVVRQGSYDTDVDGIRIVSARDFFL